MSDYDSDIQSAESYEEDELCVWIRKCFIKQYDIKQIVNRLDYEGQLQNKLEYLNPIHQQFDSYFYLIKQINQYIKQYDDIDLYLELLVKSQSFQDEISGRCHLIVTQTNTIYNLEKKIQQLFQIFHLLKDIDMNILKQSNISQIFALQKIIEINYPQCQYQSLFDQIDKFLRLIQASAQRLQYKNTPVYPLSLEFIQFKGESKQIFGEHQELDTNDVTLKKYLDYHFNILREDYIYDMRKSISYLSEKGFYMPIKSEYTHNIGLYQNINLISFQLSNYDILWRISLEQFNLDGRIKKTIDWKRSKKLSRGSLICITNVECHPLIFGIITQRSANQDDYNNLNRINLEFRFLNPKSQIMNFLTLLNQKSILLEYQTKIESNIYFLESIKKIEKLPFENFILKNLNYTSFPKYIQNNCIYNIDLSLSHQFNGKKVNLLKDAWQNQKSTLDDSQREAIKLMLSKDITLIQGPPGTGKTYCAVLAVRNLYVNLSKNDYPILIVCQTNHALEQFLESLISLIPIRDIAKLGGAPKSIALKYTHFQCKSEIEFNWSQFNVLKYQLRIILKRLSEYDYSISAKDINIFWPELSHKLINNFQYDNDLNDSQIDYKAENLILNSWLNGKCPTDSMLKYNSELFGMRSYFRKIEITEQVYQNNILESDQKPFAKDQYRNNSDEDLDEFLDSEDEYEQYQVDSQYDINLNQTKFNTLYNFQGIEKIQEYIQEKRFNPWELNDNDILEIIKYLEYLKYKEDCLLFEDTYKKFKEMSQTLKHLQEDYEILKLNKYKIIGVTVTSAARHLQKLQQLNSKVLVIEEAAEVLESHIACILMKNLQHLILIGDHYQLCPQLKCYDLRNSQKTNISLFERFYKNMIPSVKLTYQRRMKTKFADFIRLIYGQQYLDHSNVQQNRNNVDIIGLNHDLMFFNHNWLESRDTKQKENIVEGEMIVQMVQYLVLVGYEQSQISVLSFYLRQVQILQKLLINKQLNEVKVQTVDNYQGEENDIVIISLVRNNDINQLGFLENKNRINVALSRAKLGLYVFGSFDFIKKASSCDSLWQKILAMATDKQCLQDSITLKCLTHGTFRNVKQPYEWFRFNAGCCDKICNLKFDGCNHKCKKQCHLGNHPRDKCPEQCQKILECGHICEQKCVDRCTICTKKILVTLPDCSHKALITCGSDPREVVCQEDLQLTFNECQHIYNYKCSQRQNVLTICQQNCEKMLQCGHICKKKCSQACQPCEDQCIKIKPCGHKCQNLCYELCSPCNQQISIKLNCGEHFIQKKCFDIINHLILNLKITPYFIRSQIGQKYLNNIFQQLAEGSGDVLKYFIQKQEFYCRSPCQKPRQCGHILQCTNLCYQECTPCEQVISIKLECGHRYSMLCKNKKILQNFLCKKQCKRQFLCGHQQQCKQLCFEQCTPCQEIVLKQLDCGHSVRTQCFKKLQMQKVYCQICQ